MRQAITDWVSNGWLFRLFVNGKRIANASYPHGIETTTGRVHLDAGQPYQLLVEYGETTATPYPT